jgi:hypothetical protein
MKLFKRQDRYDLYADDGQKLGSTANGKLSQSNCDEIFGIVDVNTILKDIESNCEKTKEGYILGFQMAMELNKDKLFTLEDMQKAFELGHNGAADTYMLEKNEQEFEKLIQQPTKIEVEIVTETREWIKKLDSNGCLILRKL